MSEFVIIPAVDIKSGKCVRLFQGRADEETVFSNDPEDVALRWQDEGARLLHVVDLDGAFEGRPVNREIIKAVISRLSIPVQIGGGIRSMDAALDYIDAGAYRVVVGTRAFSDPDWLSELTEELGDKLAVGVDVKEGRVATGGWLEFINTTSVEAVEYLSRIGVKRIIYTEVIKDGTLEGPNFEGIKRIADNSPIPVIVSGGVGEIDDIVSIYRMRRLGVEGVIVGMALYKGEFALADALEALEREGGL
jgi:phosphoribosylformimino-5-aminoimidazole carboxamide ribotide isomerase